MLGFVVLPWLGVCPEALVVSCDHMAARTIPTWMVVLPPRARMSPGLSCCQDPCLSPWSSSRWGLCWCLWRVSPQEASGITWEEIRRLYQASCTLPCPGKDELVSPWPFFMLFIRFFILQQEHSFMSRSLLRYLLLLVKCGCWILSNKAVAVVHTFDFFLLSTIE